MAELEVTFWRDIPALVAVHGRGRSVRREMPIRFGDAIDAVAASEGLDSPAADASQFRTSRVEIEADDPEPEVRRLIEQLDRSYGPARLRRLVANGGREP
ncbi:virulence factor [Consotaella aegiceratis]|uniref:virulence factor n=1 Tax=Consotaella aegiceratis TaxID=3097961 RepID=UPI002F42C7C2